MWIADFGRAELPLGPNVQQRVPAVGQSDCQPMHEPLQLFIIGRRKGLDKNFFYGYGIISSQSMDAW